MVNESRVSIRLPVDSHLDNSGAFNDRSGSRFDRGMISHSVIRVSIPTVDCIFLACWLYPRVVATLARLAFHKITITRNIPSSKYREFQPCRVKLSVANIRWWNRWKTRRMGNNFFRQLDFIKEKEFCNSFSYEMYINRKNGFRIVLLDWI